MGRFWNRLWNFFGVAPRELWTAVSGGLDVASAPLYWVLNFSERMGRRSADIKTAIHNAINTWPHWKRWIRRPLAYLTWAVSYTTWFLRSAASWIRDTAWYLLQAVWNTFNNAWSAILWMWEPTPIKDFSFAKLQPQTATMSSVIQRRFPALATTAATGATATATGTGAARPAPATPRPPRPAPTTPRPPRPTTPTPTPGAPATPATPAGATATP